MELGRELDERLVRLADGLWRRGGLFDRDDVRQLAREHALRTLAAKDDVTVAYVLTAVRWRILDAYRIEARSSSATRSVDPFALTEESDDEDRSGWVDLAPPSVEDFSDEAIERLDASSADERDLDSLSDVAEAIEGLPLEQRAIVILHAYGLTRPEIAVVFGIPLGTVSSRAARARLRIRARLAA